jgi:hypothetical protein
VTSAKLSTAFVFFLPLKETEEPKFFAAKVTGTNSFIPPLDFPKRRREIFKNRQVLEAHGKMSRFNRVES